MTNTTLQDSTFETFESFPSAEGHKYTSIASSVQIFTEDADLVPGFVEAEAVIEFAHGGSVVSIPFRTCAPVGQQGDVQQPFDVTAHASALADLKFLKEKVDEFYTEALAAFSEFPVT